jgi:hypothetical protein
LARKAEIEGWLQQSTVDRTLFGANKIWRFRQDLKSVKLELVGLDAHGDPLNVLKKDIKRIIIEQMCVEFTLSHVDYYTESNNNYVGFDRPKLAMALGNCSLDYGSHAEKFQRSQTNFWVQVVYKKIKKLHATNMKDITYLTKLIQLFTICKNTKLESIWTVFCYQYPKICHKIIADSAPEDHADLWQIYNKNLPIVNALLDIEYSLRSGCIEEFLEYSVWLFYEFHWETLDLKLNLLQRALAVLILSGNPKRDVNLPASLCKLLSDPAMFGATSIIGGATYLLTGFNMAGCNEKAWVPELLKTLDKFVVDNCGSVQSYRWAFDEIFAALKQNGYEKDYKKEISDLKDTYEAFLMGKVGYKGQKMMRVKQRQRIVDPKLCLAKYEKLINTGYKSIGSVIYLKNKLKRSLL